MHRTSCFRASHVGCLGLGRMIVGRFMVGRSGDAKTGVKPADRHEFDASPYQATKVHVFSVSLYQVQSNLGCQDAARHSI